MIYSKYENEGTVAYNDMASEPMRYSDLEEALDYDPVPEEASMKPKDIVAAPPSVLVLGRFITALQDRKLKHDDVVQTLICWGFESEEVDYHRGNFANVVESLKRRLAEICNRG